MLFPDIPTPYELPEIFLSQTSAFLSVPALDLVTHHHHHGAGTVSSSIFFFETPPKCRFFPPSFLHLLSRTSHLSLTLSPLSHLHPPRSPQLTAAGAGKDNHHVRGLCRQPGGKAESRLRDECLPTHGWPQRASEERGSGARTATPPPEPQLPQYEPSTQLSHTNQPPRKQIPTFSLIKFHRQPQLTHLSQAPRFCLSLLPLLFFKQNCPWEASQKTWWRIRRNYVRLSPEDGFIGPSRRPQMNRRSPHPPPLCSPGARCTAREVHRAP